jgi:hypothetical protein
MLQQFTFKTFGYQRPLLNFCTVCCGMLVCQESLLDFFYLENNPSEIYSPQPQQTYSAGAFSFTNATSRNELIISFVHGNFL